MGTEPPPGQGDRLAARPPDEPDRDRQHEEGPSDGKREPPVPVRGPHESAAGEVTTPSDALQAGLHGRGGSQGQAACAEGVEHAAADTDADGDQVPPQGLARASSTEALPTWSDKVKGQPQVAPSPPTAEQVRGARMLQGVWNPLHIRRLTDTLTMDWEQSSGSEWTPHECAMRELALAPAKANRDDCLRPWTELENETLVTYMAKGLGLPHPPNFLKEILSAEHRAMVEDFHERYLNATLTINLPPTVRLAKNIPHADLFKEFFQANTDGRFGTAMMRTLQRDVKRLVFDGFHTLKVIFYSRNAAARWAHQTLRFQKAVVTLQDTARLPDDSDGGSYSSAQLELQYAVRVYGAGSLSLLAITRAFQCFAGAKVLDVEYARAQQTDIYDNRYHTVRFAQASCPTELKEVTRVQMDGRELTIHHFQTHLRRPCGRCGSPRHGNRKCTVTNKQLGSSRARHMGIFPGAVANVQPVGRTAYSISSAENLVELLTSMQVDAAMQTEPLLLRRPTTEPEATPDRGAEAESESDSALESDPKGARGSALDTDLATTRGTGPQSDTDADGYTVHRSKGARKAANRTQVDSQGKKQHDTARSHGRSPKLPPKPMEDGAERSSLPALPETKKEPASTKAKHFPKRSGGQPAGGGQAARRNGKKTKNRFAEFQRAEAKGYYSGLLEQSDSEDEDTAIAEDLDNPMQDCSEEETPVPTTDSRAPNQEPTLPKEELIVAARVEPVLRPPSGPRKPSDSKRGGQSGSNMSIKQQSMGVMADKTEKLIISATASKATRRQQIEANRTGLGELRAQADEKNGLVQTSMARFINSGEDGHSDGAVVKSEQRHAPSTESAESAQAADYVPATPDSQDDFTMGISHPGTEEGDTDNPTQLGQWLQSFDGHEVLVQANGHCAFLALYASIKNHDGGTLDNSAATVKQTTQMKSSIYACMMANLRHDVTLGLVDPIEELQKVFPHQARITSVAAATAGLFAHYAQARERAVDKSQPVEYWAGTHELRAMAQFLREPLLVLDARASGDAHIQRYLYKDYRLDNGSDHESGFVDALTDRDAADYLRCCYSLHVLPTFLVLRRQESHFYGVGHGELWVKWQAEGDPEYTASLPDSYDWKATINQLSDLEAAADLDQLNMLDDSPTVNTVIVKRIPSRDRLDIVHARRGLPTLDQNLLVDDLDVLLQTEERMLHEAYGADGYAADFSLSAGDEGLAATTPVRYSCSATGPAVSRAYQRILAEPDCSQLGQADSPLHELMQAENREAFTRWSNIFREQLGIPATRKRKAQIAELRGWLLDHYVALRHLFAYLPYPELEAKGWPQSNIMAWGAAEVFCEQTRALLRIAADGTQKAEAREYCAQWHDACMVPDLPTEVAYTLANAPERWERLQSWMPAPYGRPSPSDIPTAEWRVLHVLPYVVADWPLTLMGRAPHEARALWCRLFAPVRHLCSSITASTDWSGAADLMPTGGEATVTESPGGQPSGVSTCN